MANKLSKKRMIYELLLKSAQAAYSSSFNGQTQCLTAAFNFFTNPEVGDLVMETTTIGSRAKDSRGNIGWLMRIEPSPDGNRYSDKWIIKSLYSGEEIAWHNANFVRVLTLDDNFYDVMNNKTDNTQRGVLAADKAAVVGSDRKKKR